AEDGIRDFHVTGVQTCALPIFLAKSGDFFVVSRLNEIKEYERRIDELRSELSAFATDALHSPANEDERKAARTHFNQVKNKLTRSEERRVGKERRTWRGADREP